MNAWYLLHLCEYASRWSEVERNALYPSFEPWWAILPVTFGTGLTQSVGIDDMNKRHLIIAREVFSADIFFSKWVLASLGRRNKEEKSIIYLCKSTFNITCMEHERTEANQRSNRS